MSFKLVFLYGICLIQIEYDINHLIYKFWRKNFLNSLVRFEFITQNFFVVIFRGSCISYFRPVRDLWKVSSFLQVLGFPLPIKLITEILLKVALNTITLTPIFYWMSTAEYSWFKIHYLDTYFIYVNLRLLYTSLWCYITMFYLKVETLWSELNKPDICLSWTPNKPDTCLNQTLNKPETCLIRTLNKPKPCLN